MHLVPRAVVADCAHNPAGRRLILQGYHVAHALGQSHFRCDLAVCRPEDPVFRLVILIDGETYHAQRDVLERDMLRPRLLRSFGWRIMHVLAKDWYGDPAQVIEAIQKRLAADSAADPAAARSPFNLYPGRETVQLETALALVDQVADRQEMFCDNVGMVTLPHLFKGRVVALGDAGYCPTFLSGMGASLALVGARGLDLALRTESNNVPAALQRFSDIMQPIIAHYQQNAAENVRTMLDTSPAHALLHKWMVRLSPPMMIIRRLAKQHELAGGILAEFGPAVF